jgi:hypothetical protein
MVYSLEALNSDSDFATIQSPVGGGTVPSHAVMIYFNGSGIQDIAGPTPFIDFSTSVERNDAGEPLVFTNRITLTGKIAKGGVPTQVSNGSGIGPVMQAISGLSQIFKQNTCGSLVINCKTSPSETPTNLFVADGVRLVSFDVNKSSDNWIYTADYTAILEYLEPAYTGWYVKQYSDDWTIEPLEDYIYSRGKINVIQKSEYDNPKLLPTAPSDTAGQPAGTQTNSGGTSVGSVDIHYQSIPQFKVSRVVSAIGIPSGTGFCNAPGSKIDLDRYPALAVSAFLNAKKWVEERSSSVFDKKSGNALWSPFMGGGGGANGAPYAGYFYNHLRSVNFDIHSAKYEIRDSWLAMPTGINFIEDYSLQMSTDDKYIHTVRVEGEIIGLNISSPTITGYPYVSGSGSPIKLDLAASSGLLDNVNLSPSVIDSNAASAVISIKQSKYLNALSGWIYDVKPYIYRRACIPMNRERTKGYVPPLQNPPKPPNNPIYSKHGPLNIIPISTSETHNPKKGTISYAYEFNNKFTIISGALYESINIEETGPTDVIGEAFVLGRSLGPVLQNLGTKTSTKKTVTIEVGVVPPSSMQGFFMQNNTCPLWTGGTVYTTITGIIEGLKPFGDRASFIFGNTNFNRGNNNAQGQVYVTADNQTWDPTNGRYTKTVGWVYQQCTNSKNYLDY